MDSKWPVFLCYLCHQSLKQQFFNNCPCSILSFLLTNLQNVVKLSKRNVLQYMLNNKEEKTLQEAKFQQKRFQQAISIRKNKRTQNIEKRRHRNLLFNNFADQTINNPFFPSLSDINMVEECMKYKMMIEEPSIDKVRLGVVGIRKILQDFDPAPIQLIIDAQITPKIFQLLQQSQDLLLKAEACWIVANICSGTHEQCKYLVERGVIQLLKQSLDILVPDLLQQVLWALANIAGDGQEIRQLVIKQNVVEKFIPIFKLKNIDLTKYLIWCCSNMVRGRNKPSEDSFKQILPYMCEELKNTSIVTDLDSLDELLWSISNITQKSKARKVDIMKLNIVPDLIPILSDEQSEPVYIASLRIIGNLVAGDKSLVHYVLDSGVLPLIQTLADNPSPSVVKEVCWIISNVCAEGRKEAKLIFQNQYLMLKLLSLFESKTISIRIEIAWVFSNIAQNCDRELIYNFYRSKNIIIHFLGMLDYLQQVKSLEAGLTGIYYILGLGNYFKVNGQNPIVEQYRDEIQSVVENLQDSKSEKISSISSNILSKFFSD